MASKRPVVSEHTAPRMSSRVAKNSKTKTPEIKPERKKPATKKKSTKRTETKELGAKEPKASTSKNDFQSGEPRVSVPGVNAVNDPLPLAKSTMYDKAFGALIGSALGDCIGLYTEFMSKAEANDRYPSSKFSLTPHTPMYPDAHRKRFDDACWTDDTDQALYILLGYLHNGKLDPLDFAYRLHTWVNYGLRALDTVPRGLGAQVGKCVKDPKFLVDPVEVSYKVWTTSTPPYFAAANGSLMRCHPLGVIAVFMTQAEAFETATMYSLPTHAEPRCIVACCISIGLIRGMITQEIKDEADLDQLIEEAVDWFEAWDKIRRKDMPKTDQRKKSEPGLDRAELDRHVRVDTFQQLKLDEKDMVGYVYKCLGSVVLLLRVAMREVAKAHSEAVARSMQFETLITALTMEAGDADTNACAAGAVLGAYLGYQAIPPQWKHGLKHGKWLEHKAERLCQMLGLSTGKAKAEDDEARDGGRGVFTDADMAKKWSEHRKWLESRDTGYRFVR